MAARTRNRSRAALGDQLQDRRMARPLRPTAREAGEPVAPPSVKGIEGANLPPLRN